MENGNMVLRWCLGKRKVLGSADVSSDQSAAV